MNERYTHRNGETDPPQVHQDGGQFFWYDGQDFDERPMNEWFGLFWVCGAQAIDTTLSEYPLSEFRGRWWGPVTPPWERKPTP